MACFWSLPEAVRARAGAKLTPAGSPWTVRPNNSPVRTVTWALDGQEIRAESYYN
jgi:hypothetical protein